jgi:hypothetical protein
MRRPEVTVLFAENVTSPVIFNPSRSVFGPVVLGAFLNRFRACALDLMVAQAPSLFARFLDDIRNCHFLVGELVGRLLARSPFAAAVAGAAGVVDIVADAAVATRAIAVPFSARVPLFRLFTELLAHDAAPLSDAFLRAFGRVLREESVRQPLLRARAAAVVRAAALPDALARFLARSEFAPELRGMLLELGRHRPALAARLDAFVPAFVAGADAGDALAMLRAVAAHSLPTPLFRVLAPAVAPAHCPALLSLAAGAQTVCSGEFFIVERPSFLPLALAAVAGDAGACGRFLETCLSIGAASSHNVRMLHEGDIDAILLLALTTGAVYKGFRFRLAAPRVLALRLLEMISGAAGDRSIAKKYVNGIRDVDVREVLLRSLAPPSGGPANQFAFGNVPTACGGAAVCAEELAGSFTIGFWLRCDTALMFGNPHEFPIVRLTDAKNCMLSLRISNCRPFAEFAGAAGRTQAFVYQRITASSWMHFAFVFSREQRRERPMIWTFRNGTRCMDCYFTCPEFSRVVEVEIAGGGQATATETEFGRVAQLFISRDPLTEEDITSAMYEDAAIPGEVFSTMRLPQNAWVHKGPVSELRDAFSQPSLLRRIVGTYLETRDDKLLSIIGLLIPKSTDERLPLMFRSIVKPPCVLYFVCYHFAERIEDEDTQLLWFEDVLINGDLWGWEEASVLQHWNSVLISTFCSFFKQKSYFSYFLERFSALTDTAVLFLKRVGQLHLERADVDLLFYCLTHSERVLVLLSIIRDLSFIIKRLEYDKAAVLLRYLRNENIEIRLLALDSFHTLLGPAFYSRIWAILHYLSESLVEPIEARLAHSPTLFALNCAFVLLHPSVKLTVFPDVLPVHHYWYLFPVLLMIYGDGGQSLVDVIAKTALHATRTEIAQILSLTARFSKNAGHSDAKVLHVLLITMARFAEAARPTHLTVMLAHIIRSFLFPFYREPFSEALLRLFPDERSAIVRVANHNPMLYRPDFANLPIFLQQTLDLTGLAFQVQLEDDAPLLKYRELIEAGHTVYAALNQKLPAMSAKLDNEWKFVCSFGAPAEIKKSFYESCEVVDRLLNQCRRDLLAWDHNNDRFLSVMVKDFVTGNSIPILRRPSCVSPFSIRDDRDQVTITRSQFLTNFVPWNLTRVKGQLDIAVNSRPSSGIDVVSHRLQFPVAIFVERDTMTIKGDSYFRRILLTDVSDVIVVEETETAGSSIEIVAGHIFTLLRAPVGNALTSRPDFGKKLFPQLKTDASTTDLRQSCTAALQRRWLSGHISSFKYLSLLNALSGRTYEDLYENYPLFPSVAVADFSCCPNNFYFSLDNSILDGGRESTPVPRALFVMPEYYFLADDGRSPAAVYRNRKTLEAREDLDVWITLASGPKFRHPLPFADAPHPPRVPYVPPVMSPATFQLTDSGTLTFCAFLRRGLRFRFVSATGTVSERALLQVGTKWSLEPPTVWPAAFDMSKDGTFASTPNEVIRAACREFVVVGTTPTPVVAEVSLASFEISEDCCQLSITELGTFHIGTTVTIECFATVPERILCFARSNKFNITAVGCQDGKLRIRSNETGLKVATVSLGGEIATRILITRSWGFIAVKTDESIFVFTVNGLIVGKIEDKSRWRRWFTFRTRVGVDFIGFSMEDGTIKYIEAAEPENVATLPIAGAVCAWTYLWRQDCFGVVHERGMLFLVPRASAIRAASTQAGLP